MDNQTSPGIDDYHRALEDVRRLVKISWDKAADSGETWDLGTVLDLLTHLDSKRKELDKSDNKVQNKLTQT